MATGSIYHAAVAAQPEAGSLGLDGGGCMCCCKSRLIMLRRWRECCCATQLKAYIQNGGWASPRTVAFSLVGSVSDYMAPRRVESLGPSWGHTKARCLRFPLFLLGLWSALLDVTRAGFSYAASDDARLRIYVCLVFFSNSFI